jgi:hypothetical protein
MTFETDQNALLTYVIATIDNLFVFIINFFKNHLISFDSLLFFDEPCRVFTGLFYVLVIVTYLCDELSKLIFTGVVALVGRVT